jgi:hypothetical protein
MPLWARPVTGLQIDGHAPRSRTDSSATIVHTVDRDYFATMEIAIDKGRDVAESDRVGTLPVAIVNAKLASDYWPGENPLGFRLHLPGEKQMREVIGIARTAN